MSKGTENSDHTASDMKRNLTPDFVDFTSSYHLFLKNSLGHYTLVRIFNFSYSTYVISISSNSSNKTLHLPIKP